MFLRYVLHKCQHWLIRSPIILYTHQPSQRTVLLHKKADTQTNKGGLLNLFGHWLTSVHASNQPHNEKVFKVSNKLIAVLIAIVSFSLIGRINNSVFILIPNTLNLSLWTSASHYNYDTQILKLNHDFLNHDFLNGYKACLQQAPTTTTRNPCLISALGFLYQSDKSVTLTSLFQPSGITIYHKYNQFWTLNNNSGEDNTSSKNDENHNDSLSSNNTLQTPPTDILNELSEDDWGVSRDVILNQPPILLTPIRNALSPNYIQTQTAINTLFRINTLQQIELLLNLLSSLSATKPASTNFNGTNNTSQLLHPDSTNPLSGVTFYSLDDAVIFWDTDYKVIWGYLQGGMQCSVPVDVSTFYIEPAITPFYVNSETAAMIEADAISDILQSEYLDEMLSVLQINNALRSNSDTTDTLNTAQVIFSNVQRHSTISVCYGDLFDIALVFYDKRLIGTTILLWDTNTPWFYLPIPFKERETIDAWNRMFLASATELHTDAIIIRSIDQYRYFRFSLAESRWEFFTIMQHDISLPCWRNKEMGVVMCGFAVSPEFFYNTKPKKLIDVMMLP